MQRADLLSMIQVDLSGLKTIQVNRYAIVSIKNYVSDT